MRQLRRLATVCSAAVIAATLAIGVTPTAVAETRSAPQTQRLAGADRFGTAIAAAQAAFPGTAPVVYIASGLDFPDALSAGPIAAKAGGPLLLVRPGAVRSDTEAEIRRLQPQRVVIVGGTASVSADVEQALRSLAPTVDRVGGSDRFGTSRLLAEDAFRGPVPAVHLVTGRDFPDALSAGAAAARAGGPVLLIDGAAAALDAGTVHLIRVLSPDTITVVGGTNVVTDGVLAHAGTLAGTVTRVAGSNRYETSAAIGRTWGPTPHAYLANGLMFPDALVGSAIAGKEGAPLYITDASCLPGAVSAAQWDAGTTKLTLLGGPNVMHSDVHSCEFLP